MRLPLHILAHETGHILVGYGHPNDKDFPGPAPLPGTDPSRRLMHSDVEKNGILLVKKEWDEADEWLETTLPPSCGGTNSGSQ